MYQALYDFIRFFQSLQSKVGQKALIQVCEKGKNTSIATDIWVNNQESSDEGEMAFCVTEISGGFAEKLAGSWKVDNRVREGDGRAF